MQRHEQLTEALLNNELDDAQAAELEAWLLADANHRRHFAMRTFEHRMLRDTLVGQAEDHQSDLEESAMTQRSVVIRAARTSGDFLRRPTPMSLSVAAVVILLLVTTMAFMAPPFYRAMIAKDDRQHNEAINIVARITGLHEAVWAAGQTASHQGAFLQSGHRMQLNSGVVEITYHSGARVLLEGPAEYEVSEPNGGQLHAGRLVAKLQEKSAQGFRIRTANLHVEDLGTEFGLAVDKQQTELIVFDGLVSVRSSESDRHLGNFAKGQAVKFEADRFTRTNFARQAEQYQRRSAARVATDEILRRAAGIWQFDGNLESATGAAQSLRANGFTPSYVQANINGRPATVLDLPALTPAQTLAATNTAGGNGSPGDNARTNDWTLVMDVNFGETLGPFTALLQIDPTNQSDVNVFLREDGSIDLGTAQSVAPGAFPTNTWVRLAVRSRSNGNHVIVEAFINGRALSGASQNAIDGTGSQGTSLTSEFLLFSDNDGETTAAQISSLAFWHEPLSSRMIAALGGPSAEKISTKTPELPEKTAIP